MTKTLTLCAILMGWTVVLTARLWPDSVVMWFMSPTEQMMVWREVLLAALTILALVEMHYDNRIVRSLSGLIAVLLLWIGYEYFLDNAAFILDTLFIALAAVAFGIAALQTAEEPRPIVGPALVLAALLVKSSFKGTAGHYRPLNQNSTLLPVDWQRLGDNDHHLKARHMIRV